MSDPISQGDKTMSPNLSNVCTDAAKLNTDLLLYFLQFWRKTGRSLKTFCFKRKQKLFPKTSN